MAVGADDLPDAVPDVGRPPGGRARQAGRGGRAVAARRGPAAPGDRVRGDGRSLEHLGLRRRVQPLSRRREQRPRPPRRRIAGHDRRHLHALRADPQGGGGGRRDRLQQTLSRNLAALARWWDKFATVEVDSVEGISGQATLESAESVAAALRAWHEGGAAAGDLAFWRRHVEHFRSPKAYALVIDTLLDHRDLVAAMALLVQWLSQAEEIPLVEEDYSFHDLALAWMEDLWRATSRLRRPPSRPSKRPSNVTLDLPALAADAAPQRWPLARKFLDYLEANAEEYWQVPRFEMAAEALGTDGRQDENRRTNRRTIRGRRVDDGRRRGRPLRRRPTKT